MLSNLTCTKVVGILTVVFSCISINILAQNRTSVQSGNWSNKNTWDCNCVPASTENAVIANGHTVTMVGGSTSIRNLTINSGGILTDNGGSLTVAGSLTVNGTLSGTGAIALTGASTTIGGGGTISNPSDITITGNKSIPSSSALEKNLGNIIISASTTVTNNGTFTIGGNINGVNSTSSVWTNALNATLNAGGSVMTTGRLNATNNGNTVNYFGAASQDIKMTDYHHLTLSGSGQKTLGANNYTINGNVTISSTLSAGTGIKTITVLGNWINTGSFIAGSSNVVFSGSATQTIQNEAGENFFGLQINKPTSTLQLIGNTTVSNSLTMVSGTINTGVYKIILGTSVSNPGSLTYTAGTIAGKFERYVNATNTTYRFPVGVSFNDRTATVSFANLTSGSLTVEFIPSFAGNSGLPLSESGVTLYNTFNDGYWSLTAGNGLSSTNYNITLDGAGFTGFTVNPNTRILTRSNSASAWTLNGSHNGVSGSIIGRNNVSTLSAEFAFGDDTNCQAPQAKTISGPTVNVCTNSIQTYSVPKTIGNDYAWTCISGTILTGLTDTTTVITVQWGSNGVVGQLSVQESNGCTSGPVNTLNVDLNPVPALAITGRTSVPQNALSYVYSIPAQSGYSSYTWSVTGGTIVSGQGTNTITVNWGTFGTGIMCVTSTHPSCGSSVNTCMNVEIYRVVFSSRTGNWGSQNTWSCNCVPESTDNVTILNTHNVTANNTPTIRHLSVNAGGSLAINSALTVTGDLTINGTLSGVSNLNLSSSSMVIDGTGNFTHSGPVTLSGSRTITSRALLSKTGTLTLGDGVVITNQGNLNVVGDINGTSTSRWVNSAGSTLTISGNLMGTGTLDASASNNTVVYSGGAQNIKDALNNQYANLTLSGTGAKTAPAVLKISGNIVADTTFSHGSGTVYFNGNTTITGRTNPIFNNVQVEGILNVPASFQLAGNLNVDNAATFNITSSDQTTWFRGTSSQSIRGKKNSFRNIRVSNTAGVFVENSQDMYGLLTVNANGLFDADGSADTARFVMQSTSDSPAVDASVGPLLSGARVDGRVIVERFVSGEGRFYRYLSSPVVNATVADLQDDFMVTGNFNDPSTTPAWKCGIPVNTRGSSLFYYNEAATGSQANGYIAYPLAGSSAASSTLTRGLGYSAYIRQCDVADSVVIDFSGPLNQGTFAMPVSFTNTPIATPGSDGWNLLGNPYASAITWNLNLGSGGWISNNISPVISIRDAPGNRFVYIDGSTSSGTIAIGQAFWVQALAPGASLTIQEGVKQTASGYSFYRRDNGDVAKTILTVRQLATGYIDEAFITVRENSLVERDAFDATKLDNELFDLSTITPQGKKMAINSVDAVMLNTWIPVDFSDAEAGAYTLTASSSGELSQYIIELRDIYTGKRTVLKRGESYHFEITPNEAGGAARFSIRYLTDMPVSEQEEIVLSAYPNPTSDKISVVIPEGITVTSATMLAVTGVKISAREVTHEDKAVSFDLSKNENGVYLIQLTGPAFNKTVRVVKK